MKKHQKTMLITGGSRGIGRATALLAAKRGWSVALNYRADADMAVKTASEVRESGVACEIYQADVTDEAAVQAMFSDAIARFGRLDAVIINAGVVAPKSTVANMSVQRMEKVIRINVMGAFICAREAARCLPRDSSEPAGTIVFVSSIASRLGSAFEYVDYAASKGAVDTLATGLSLELASENVRVNTVRPGLIETDIHASGGQPDRAQRIGAQLPLGRPGKATEVAESILFLASEESAYITGSFIDIGGGR